MVGDITEEVMLVEGLGLDSLNLAHLVENLRQTYRHINFTPWFVEASREGRDTVGILVDFIARGFRGVQGAGDV
jgi:hypothetical protein